MYDSWDDPTTKNAVFAVYQRHTDSEYGSWKGTDGSTGWDAASTTFFDSRRRVLCLVPIVHGGIAIKQATRVVLASPVLPPPASHRRPDS